MPLKWLHLYGTKVTDLSPLKGMPLEIVASGRNQGDGPLGPAWNASD